MPTGSDLHAYRFVLRRVNICSGVCLEGKMAKQERIALWILVQQACMPAYASLLFKNENAERDHASLHDYR